MNKQSTLVFDNNTGIWCLITMDGFDIVVSQEQAIELIEDGIKVKRVN